MDDDSEDTATEDVNVDDGGKAEEEYDDLQLSSSPDAETTILFTKPLGSASDLPAGQVAEFLIGFANKGNQDMLIESVEAAFHYPMDHTFVIQNFSAIQYGKVVKPLNRPPSGTRSSPPSPSLEDLSVCPSTWLTETWMVALSVNWSSTKRSTLLKLMKVWTVKRSSSTCFSLPVSFSCSSWVNKPSPLWVNDEEVLQGWRLELPGTPATYLMMVSTTIGFLRKL